jgi:signal transduction histidine kinase
MQLRPAFPKMSYQALIQGLINESERLLLLIDRNGYILTCNHKAEEFLGKDLLSIQGMNIGDLFIQPNPVNKISTNSELEKIAESMSGTYLYSQERGPQVSLLLYAKKFEEAGTGLILLSGRLPDEGITGSIRGINQLLLSLVDSPGDQTDISGLLKKVASYIVPSVADLCIIYIVDQGGSMVRIATQPEEIINEQSMYDWLENDLINDEIDGLPSIIKTQMIKIVYEINPIRRIANTGIKSYGIIPIKYNQNVIGAFTLATTQDSPHSIQNSVDIVQNISLQIAPFIQNKMDFSEGESINESSEVKSRLDPTELQEAMDHLKQSDEFIQTLFRISNRLNATLDIDQILDTLAQEAIQLVNGESGFAGLRTQNGMTVKKYFNQGTEIPFEHDWTIGDGIPGWVLKYKVPYGTSDAANDPILNKDLSINANIRSIICTPILDTFGEVIAYFDIRNKIGLESFSINDQEMLLTLAPVASIAIQNALAYQQRLATVAELKESAKRYQQLATSLETTREEERVQIARELHDQLGQSLTAIKFDLSWLADQLGRFDDNLVQKSKDIIIQVNTLINLVRRIATGLRPGMLEDLGLIASIEWQAQDFQKRSGIECNINNTSEDLDLTKEQSLAIYRIFQEALTNIVRYADAKKVNINLDKSGDLFRMQISDDGKGISPVDSSNNLSIGIMGMQERVKQLGGIFEIQGNPDQGTIIKVTLPVQKGN